MNLKILYILICVFFCKNIETKLSRIIGGESARAGQFPFSAAIYLSRQNGNYFCGGALLSNRWILTAGQCVYEAVLFTIHLGSNNIDLDVTDSNRLIVSTSNYVLHPEFNKNTLENDIGLINLREPVFYNDYIQRVQIAYDYTDDYTSLIAIGWGQTSDTDNSLSPALQYVTLANIPISECRNLYGNQIGDQMVCVAGQLNEGTCIGDTGSPLLDDDNVSRSIRHVGIASFVSGNGCENTDPSGYTKTYSFRDWIQNVTAL